MTMVMAARRFAERRREHPGPRGWRETKAFRAAMRHELDDNAHKGHWLEDEDGKQRKPAEMLGDLMYHAAKLGVALVKGDKYAILEYAADVGNCAWFLADQAGALDLKYLHDGPIDTDPKHPVFLEGQRTHMRRRTHELANYVYGELAGGEKAPLPADIPPSEVRR